MSATCDGIQIGKLRLWEEQGGGIELVPDEFCRTLAPATHCLREWTDYWVEYPGAESFRVGSRSAPESHGRFKVRFENQLGITQLQPYVGSQSLSEPLYVEVISPKFPTPSEHCAFYQRLLDDLFARAARIPFTASALTARGVTESLRPPSPLFVLHLGNARVSVLQQDDCAAAWRGRPMAEETPAITRRGPGLGFKGLR